MVRFARLCNTIKLITWSLSHLVTDLFGFQNFQSSGQPCPVANDSLALKINSLGLILCKKLSSRTVVKNSLSEFSNQNAAESLCFVILRIKFFSKRFLSSQSYHSNNRRCEMGAIRFDQLYLYLKRIFEFLSLRDRVRVVSCLFKFSDYQAVVELNGLVASDDLFPCLIDRRINFKNLIGCHLFLSVKNLLLYRSSFSSAKSNPNSELTDRQLIVEFLTMSKLQILKLNFLTQTQ